MCACVKVVPMAGVLLVCFRYLMAGSVIGPGGFKLISQLVRPSDHIGIFFALMINRVLGWLVTDPLLNSFVTRFKSKH